MLLRDPSELSASEIAQWDTLAASEEAPDPQSGASAWQVSGLACSRRAGASIVLRQAGDSQIAFAVTQTLRGYRLGPLEAHWFFGCPLIGPKAVELLAGVVSELRDELSADVIEVIVSGLRPEGPIAKQIDARFDNVRKQEQDPHAAASLEGGIDGWLSRRGSNFRRNLKRSERRAQAAGIQFERMRPSSAIDADRCYERMLAVEHRSWKGPRREGLLAIRSFYQTLLRAYALRGWARVVFARQADDDVGFCFGGASHGIYRGQQTSYCERRFALSLGTLMHFETMKWLVEDGASLQHFGPIQRMMSYKSSYCEMELPSSLTVFQG